MRLKFKFKLNQFLIMVLVIIQSGSYSAFAQVAKELTLQKVLDYTIANSPIVLRTVSELEKSKTTLKQVEAMKILPFANLDIRTGIVPEAKGNVLFSPNNKFELNNWGPFFQTELTLIQPLYTFGKISNAEKGATELVNIQVYKNQSDINELSINAIQTYWALNAASKAVEIAGKLQIAYDSLVAKINTEIKKEDSELDQSYLFEVKSNEYNVKSLYLNSYTNRKLAFKTFYELVGLNIDTSTVFVDEKSPDFNLDDSELETSINKALLCNQEILMIETGLKAVDDKINFYSSSKYPQLFLAAGIQYGYAANRDKQDNPFVYDNFNYLNAGGFVGMKWDLNFSSMNIEQQQCEAEKNSLNENLKLLKSKIKVDVTKSFLDAKSNFEQLSEIRKSLNSAKSWVEMTYDNLSLGIGEPDRLIKATSTYFQLKIKELEKEYEYNVSLAKHAYLMGDFKNYLKWIKNEKIEF